ncbi:hypothetical protein Bphy_6910 (plasmid) [Paraburkholderia phymatum STM815]|uniref:Uncharacterized protein n=1 Tax=Paraburkholderia phymatum (strain DSM 17167 / CIP 108236 / LMG 21445 / STM815) TaxID=391038 RepID=B2JTL8_PARP8|nr:hypothetical protein Bphy_6910 [Paraburkholderia phymatum STM815]
MRRPVCINARRASARRSAARAQAPPDPWCQNAGGTHAVEALPTRQREHEALTAGLTGRATDHSGQLAHLSAPTETPGKVAVELLAALPVPLQRQPPPVETVGARAQPVLLPAERRVRTDRRRSSIGIAPAPAARTELAFESLRPRKAHCGGLAGLWRSGARTPSAASTGLAGRADASTSASALNAAV